MPTAAPAPKTSRAQGSLSISDEATYAAWNAQIHDPAVWSQLRDAGNVYIRPTLHSGIHIVVDGTLLTNTIPLEAKSRGGNRRRRGPQAGPNARASRRRRPRRSAHPQSVKVLTAYNIHYPHGDTREIHRIFPHDTFATKLTGLHNLRTRPPRTLADVLVPNAPSFALSKKTLHAGSAQSPALTPAAHAAALLEAYAKVHARVYGGQADKNPATDTSRDGIVNQVRRWVASVQDVIDTDANATVTLRFAYVPYVPRANLRDVRPENTQLCVPYAAAVKIMGGLMLRVRTGTVRGKGKDQPEMDRGGRGPGRAVPLYAYVRIQDALEEAEPKAGQGPSLSPAQAARVSSAAGQQGYLTVSVDAAGDALPDAHAGIVSGTEVVHLCTRN